jgi:hypothetical protein
MHAQKLVCMRIHVAETGTWTRAPPQIRASGARPRLYMSNGPCRAGPARARLGPAREALVQARHGLVSCRAGPARGPANAAQARHGYSYTGRAGPEARRACRAGSGPVP